MKRATEISAEEQQWKFQTWLMEQQLDAYVTALRMLGSRAPLNFNIETVGNAATALAIIVTMFRTVREDGELDQDWKDGVTNDIDEFRSDLTEALRKFLKPVEIESEQWDEFINDK